MRWEIRTTTEVGHAERGALRALWAEAFDDFTDDDAEHAYGGVHVLAYDGEVLVGHASAVPRRLRFDDVWVEAGYVEGVAVLPACQAGGVGTALVTALHGELAVRWPVAVLSTGRRSFYGRLGWSPWRGPSYVVRGGAAVRTPEEDDGLMARSFDPALVLDVEAAITCEDRSGDCW